MVAVARLLKEQNDNIYVKQVRLEDNPQRLKGVLSETRWTILNLLAERPRYPAELADLLDVHEQNVYYHIRELKDNGFIEVVNQEERGGALAKYYAPVDDGFALELPHGDERVTENSAQNAPEHLQQFLTPFIANGELDTRIVVGSPDPHGPHQVRARDAHLATDIGTFLGQYGTVNGRCTVQDVDVKAADTFTGNMVLLGGPLTNMVTADVNAHLPVKFDTDQFPFRTVTSTQTGETYDEEAIGFVNKLPNPHDPEHALIVIAGVRLKGTTAAVLALTEHYETVLENYAGEDKWGAVVRGKDMDGDGEIDEIEVVE